MRSDLSPACGRKPTKLALPEHASKAGVGLHAAPTHNSRSLRQSMRGSDQIERRRSEPGRGNRESRLTKPHEPAKRKKTSAFRRVMRPRGSM